MKNISKLLLSFFLVVSVSNYVVHAKYTENKTISLIPESQVETTDSISTIELSKKLMGLKTIFNDSLIADIKNIFNSSDCAKAWEKAYITFITFCEQKKGISNPNINAKRELYQFGLRNAALCMQLKASLNTIAQEVIKEFFDLMPSNIQDETAELNESVILTTLDFIATKETSDDIKINMIIGKYDKMIADFNETLKHTCLYDLAKKITPFNKTPLECLFKKVFSTIALKNKTLLAEIIKIQQTLAASTILNDHAKEITIAFLNELTAQAPDKVASIKERIKKT